MTSEARDIEEEVYIHTTDILEFEKLKDFCKSYSVGRNPLGIPVFHLMFNKKEFYEIIEES